MEKIAVIIPCYRVRDHILDVISAIGNETKFIICVDDACPENTGDYIEEFVEDTRVVVVRHEFNMGVGGAVMTGYKLAIDYGADILVKIDGDGQMCPSQIKKFVLPIVEAKADYTKGNRFWDIQSLGGMPKSRLFGNSILSLMSKLSSGYWNIFDPTNGYTAIHANVAKRIPFDKVSNRYFFESDLLFRLNTLKAVVIDIPIYSKYANEVSNLNIPLSIFEFSYKHIRNFIKRIFYNYYLRDFSLASIELPVGLLMIIFGSYIGIESWEKSLILGVPNSAGTVMLSALPILMGLQFVMQFLAYDISSVPSTTVNKRL